VGFFFFFCVCGVDGGECSRAGEASYDNNGYKVFGTKIKIYFIYFDKKKKTNPSSSNIDIEMIY